MKLTKHFTLEEMTRSQTATRYGIDNMPNEEQIRNLQHVCGLLESARNIGGAPINTSSGFRCVALNRTIGGSNTSQHCNGEAADINMTGKTPAELMRIILESGVEFNQLIWEFGRWVHFASSRTGQNKYQILKAEKVHGKTVYTEITRSDVGDL